MVSLTTVGSEVAVLCVEALCRAHSPSDSTGAFVNAVNALYKCTLQPLEAVAIARSTFTQL